MLHILLLILKIIGITLAVLLGLVLLLVCMVLFVPIRYKGNGQKMQEEISGQVKVTWLFHLVTFTLTYKEGKMSQVLRVFGINLQSLKNLFRRNKKDKAENVGTSEKLDTSENRIDLESNRIEQSTAGKAIELTDKAEKETATKKASQSETEELEKINPYSGENHENNIAIRGRITAFLKKIPAFIKKAFQKVWDVICLVFQMPGKIIGLFKKISLTFHNACDKIKYWKDFLNDEKTRAALVCVKTGIVRLFKHILPKKLKGEIRYGFEDPSTTGQVLGVIYMLYPACQNHISICPDFEHQVLEGYLELKGRIYVCTLLWIALKIYFDKNFKSVLNILLHKEEL